MGLGLDSTSHSSYDLSIRSSENLLERIKVAFTRMGRRIEYCDRMQRQGNRLQISFQIAELIAVVKTDITAACS